ncbi:MAG TPA: hypothetical protein PKH16_15375 [Aequorivita sp.]|nr:hypothetical protein [Aequorivita sp.]
MEEYSLSSKSIYNILKDKGVFYLHHANTVSTAITFIENNALLSRNYVELNGLFQSAQKSDSEDKLFDVWDHVFLDGEDLHKRYKRANKYGPVLFRFKLDMLTSPLLQKIYITKSNPWYWNKETTMGDRFYKSIEEVSKDYLTGKRLDSQIMFTIRNPEKEIKLNKFIHSIGIDKPKLLVNLSSGEQTTAGDYSYDSIRKSMDENSLKHIPLLVRHEGKISFCSCHANYNYLHAFDKSEFKKRFAKKKS